MENRKPDWMDNVIPPYVRSIPAYVPGKPVAELYRELGITEAIKMASNENPLGPSPKAVRAMEQHLRSTHVYPESSGPDLRAELAVRLGVPSDSIILGNGSDEIMDMAAHVLLSVGDEAVMGESAFSMYRICVQAFGGTPVRVPLKGFRLDLPAMAKAVTDRTRLVFVTIPNSPTGTIVSRPEFEAFLADLPRDRLVLVLDEAYREYVRDADCPRGIDYLEGQVPVLVLRTFSKIYGLAGLRVGYGIGQPWLIEVLNRVRAPFNVNTLAQAAALAAIDDTEHVERSLELNRQGIAYLTEELSGMGLEVIPSEANFVTFCVNENARPYYDGLLKKGIIVRHLASFCMDGCIRVTVGKPEHNQRFIHALRDVMAQHG
jgi:histidinol-phosphate aminotransferase